MEKDQEAPLVRRWCARENKAVVRPRSERDESPVFSHQVLALLARMAREDRELIGATYRRTRSREGKQSEHDSFQAVIAALPQAPGGPFSHLCLPSAVGRDRQSGAGRIPHFDMLPITKSVVPTSKDGAVHESFKNVKMSSTDHFAYIVDGGHISLTSHLDYLQREGAAELRDQDRVLVDLAEEHEERWWKNALAIYSNIPDGPERQRSLFAAAEATEQTPKKHYLELSTEHLDQMAWIAGLATCPSWLPDMERRLRKEQAAIQSRAEAAGKAGKPQTVVVAEVTPEQAYDILRWFDAHPSAPRPTWKQGKTGRNHYRFVGELPKGLSNRQRHRIMRAFVDMLANDGWMVVGVIHQPDQHNDKRNYHFHIDAYDRPAKWLEEHKLWDFEWKVRRNGKDTFPLRQKKVSYRERDEAGKQRKVDTATIMRDRYIDIVNAVVGNRPSIDFYLKGTYADNGIGLTPLEHLGNRAAARERRGFETAAGLRNARRIVVDDLAAIERQAEAELIAISRECDVSRSRLVGQHDALAAVDELDWLRRRDVRVRQESKVAEVVGAMARSRSEAVMAVLSPELGRRERRRKDDKELLEAASDHLTWVDAQKPSFQDTNEQHKRTRENELRQRELEAFVVSRVDQKSRADPPLIYLSRRKDRAPQPATKPYYRQRMETRLVQWLEKNGADPAKLQLEGDIVSLGRGVPQAIDTLMQRFINVPRLQSLIAAERARRENARDITAQSKRMQKPTGEPFRTTERLRPELKTQVSGIEQRTLGNEVSQSRDLAGPTKSLVIAQQAERLKSGDTLRESSGSKPVARTYIKSLGKGPSPSIDDVKAKEKTPAAGDNNGPVDGARREHAGASKLKQIRLKCPTYPLPTGPASGSIEHRRPMSLHEAPKLSKVPSLSEVPFLGKEAASVGGIKRAMVADPPTSPQDPLLQGSVVQASTEVSAATARKTNDGRRFDRSDATHTASPDPQRAAGGRELGHVLKVVTAMPFLPLRPRTNTDQSTRYAVSLHDAAGDDRASLELVCKFETLPAIQRLLHTKHENMLRAVLAEPAASTINARDDVAGIFGQNPRLAAAVKAAWGHWSLTHVIDQARKNRRLQERVTEAQDGLSVMDLLQHRKDRRQGR